MNTIYGFIDSLSEITMYIFFPFVFVIFAHAASIITFDTLKIKERFKQVYCITLYLCMSFVFFKYTQDKYSLTIAFITLAYSLSFFTYYSLSVYKRLELKIKQTKKGETNERV